MELLTAIFTTVFLSGAHCPVEFVFDNASSQNLTLHIYDEGAPGGKQSARPRSSRRFEAILACSACHPLRRARVTDESGTEIFSSRGNQQRIFCDDQGCQADRGP